MTVCAGGPKSCRQTHQTHHRHSRVATSDCRTFHADAAFYDGSAIVEIVAAKLARMPERTATRAVRRVTRKAVRRAFARSRWRQVPADARRAYSIAVTTEIIAFVEVIWAQIGSRRRAETSPEGSMGPS